ncbi:hypothetical protein GCM10017612_07510 [Novosphingobium resinovorum]|nr:hypothetical protein GCM10017612_07510 [Novosphingobium resinovorum]
MSVKTIPTPKNTVLRSVRRWITGDTGVIQTPILTRLYRVSALSDWSPAGTPCERSGIFPSYANAQAMEW